MKTPPALIKSIIELHQLDELSAYDQQEKCRIYYVTGSPEELCEHLDTLTRSLQGTFLVKARKAAKGRGNVAKSVAPYSWLCVGSATREPEPVAPISGAIGSPDPLSSDLMNELIELRADRIARDRIAALEDEDDDEPEPALPMNKLAELIGQILVKSIAPAPAPAPSSPSGGIGADRLAAITTAIQNLHRQDPDSFAQYESALLTHYGNAKPQA
jgi:hypothetical protein